MVCRRGAPSIAAWSVRGRRGPSRLSLPQQGSHCRDGGEGGAFPSDAAHLRDPLANCLGDPRLAHHPFHSRRVSFGSGGGSRRIAPWTGDKRCWQRQLGFERPQRRGLQACRNHAADARGPDRIRRHNLPATDATLVETRAGVLDIPTSSYLEINASVLGFCLDRLQAPQKRPVFFFVGCRARGAACPP